VLGKAQIRCLHLTGLTQRQNRVSNTGMSLVMHMYYLFLKRVPKSVRFITYRVMVLMDFPESYDSTPLASYDVVLFIPLAMVDIIRLANRDHNIMVKEICHDIRTYIDSTPALAWSIYQKLYYCRGIALENGFVFS
jgi:hypothetical protein